MAIIVDQPILYYHSSIMVEGSRDVLVPLVVVECSVLDLGLYLLYGGHDHCSEVLGLENYDFIVIVFALLMVCSSTKQVSFLVHRSWFVVKREVVLCQFGYPTCLSSVQPLGFSEVLEILVICPDFEILSCSH